VQTIQAFLKEGVGALTYLHWEYALLPAVNELIWSEDGKAVCNYDLFYIVFVNFILYR